MQKDVLRSRSPSRPNDGDLLDCHPVEGRTELAHHFRVRHEVFVCEQQLFAESDHDGHDDDPATIHVLGLVGGLPAGSVRLYPLGDGLWKGDRLAVLRRHRRAGIGRPLVKCAVALAASRGGHRMDAQIQLPNVTFFKVLGWSSVGDPVDQFGVAHQPMSIPLR